jgi:hypothetical protein
MDEPRAHGCGRSGGVTDLHSRRSATLVSCELRRWACVPQSTGPRSLIVLYYFLDLSLAEAAVAVGIPNGTAKSRLARARDTLRATLDADARPGRELAEGSPA